MSHESTRFLRIHFQSNSTLLSFNDMKYSSLLHHFFCYTILLENYRKKVKASMKLTSLFKKRATCHFKVFRQTLFHPDIGRYKTYGIRCSKKSTVNDVSCDLARAKYIARCLNKANTDPTELVSAVESFL